MPTGSRSRQPSFLHASDEGIGEHGGAGRFGPEVGLVDELVPEAFAVAVAKQALHHLPVALQDAFVVGVVLWQGFQHLGQPDGHPSVAACPVERCVGRVVEEAVGPLQFVEVFHHFVRGPVDVLAVARGAIGPGLDYRNHVHVVDPHAGLPGVALSCEPFLALLGFSRQFPLRVGIGESHRLVVLFRGERRVEAERQGAEHVEIYVVLGWNVLFVVCQEAVEAFLHLADDDVVAHGPSPHEGAVPGAYLVVAQVLRVAPGGVLAVDEVVGKAPSHLFGRGARREVAKGVVLPGTCSERKQQGDDD